MTGSGLPRSDAAGEAAASRLYRVRVGDFLLAFLVLAACTAGVVALSGRDRGPGHTAVLYADGERLRALPLTRRRSLSLVVGGHHFVIETDIGRIRVAKSDCPRQVCVRAGWISGPHQTIVCLPAKLVVKIEGAPDAPDVDAFTE